MAQDNWWQNDAPVGNAPAQQAPRAPTPPPFIPGVVSPTKQAAEARAQAAEQRAQQDQALQLQKFNLDLNKEDRTAKKDAAGTVDEKKVATLTTRLAGAFSDINSVRKVDPSAQEPGVIESMRGGLSPGGMTGIVVRGIAGQNRRIVYDAEMDALDALLTLGTGAAYTREQLEGQRASYFPQYGDSKEEVAFKNQRLQRLIEAAKANAGPAWANVEPQIAQFMGGFSAAGGGNIPDKRNEETNPFTGLPGKSEAGPSDPIGEDPRFAGKRYNESGQEDPNGNFNAYGQYRDFRAMQAPADGPLEASVTGFEGQPQESLDNWTNWTDKQGRTRGPDGSVLSGWQGPGRGGSYENALQQELQRQGKGDPTSAENYIMRGAQGGSFSLADELVGAMSAAKGGMQGNDPVLSYQLARDLERSRQRQNEQGQGKLGYVAEIAPSILTGNLLGDVRGAQNAMKVGAKGGALYGFGSGQGLSDSTSRAGTGALAGAVLGAGINQVGEKVVAPGFNALAKSRVGQSVKNAFTRTGNAQDEIAATVNPAELIAAGKANNVRVMTSDAFPPKTAVGKTARMIGENIPFLGTGGTRAAQQAERAAAVQRFAKEFQVEGGTVDGVTKNLLKTRGKQIETLTTAKNSVIESVPGTVQTSNTLNAIDNKIAELTARNTETSRELADVLKGMRKDFEGKSLPQLEAMRVDELSSAFKSDSMARIRDLGEKTIRSLYTPLKEDMGAFIKANGKPGDFNKWSMANKKLSDMMGDLKSAKFKSTLNNGATTPEEARKLLFSQTPSDVQRLVKELSPKGQAKARSAVVSEVLDKATDEASGMVSPEKFLNAINALKPTTGSLFKGEHGERLDGLVKLLGGTRRAAQTNAEIPNGLQATRFGVAGGAVINPKFSVPAGLLARAYESPVVRDLLVKLGRSKPGSPVEAATQSRLIDIITRVGSTRAPEAANDTLGSILSLSPGRAAAEDETN